MTRSELKSVTPACPGVGILPTERIWPRHLISYRQLEGAMQLQDSLHACKQKLRLRAEKYGRSHRRVMRVLVRLDLRMDQDLPGPAEDPP